MERSMVLGAFAIAWLCCLGSMFLAFARRESPAGTSAISRFTGMTASMIVALVFLATLPTHAPFSEGHGWGIGFALGGVAALAGVWLVKTAQSGTSNNLLTTITVVGPQSLAILAASVPLLWLRSSVVDALVGVAIGWFVVTMIALLPDWTTEDPSRAQTLPLLAGTGFALVLCTLCALGEIRDPVSFLTPGSRISFGALGLALASCLTFLTLLCAFLNSLFTGIATRVPLVPFFVRLIRQADDSEANLRAGVRGLQFLTTAILFWLFGRLLMARILDKTALTSLLGIGLVMGLLAWWLTAEREQTDEETTLVSGWQRDGLGALVVVAGIMAAFQMQSGVGVGLMLLAAWLVVGLVMVRTQEQAGDTAVAARVRLTTGRLLKLLFVGVVLLLYRLFTVRFAGDIRGVALTDQYALFGFLVGTMLPAFLTGFLLQTLWTTDSEAQRLWRLIVVGIVALAVPALFVILWGAKCTLALLFGLALSVLVTEVPEQRKTLSSEAQDGRADVPPRPQQSEPRLRESRGERGRRGRGVRAEVSLLPGLMACAMALALTQWTHAALALAQLTRPQKVHVLEGVVAGLIVLLWASDAVGRFQNRRSRGTGRAVPQGGAQ